MVGRVLLPIDRWLSTSLGMLGEGRDGHLSRVSWAVGELLRGDPACSSALTT